MLLGSKYSDTTSLRTRSQNRVLVQQASQSNDFEDDFASRETFVQVLEKGAKLNGSIQQVPAETNQM